MMRRQSAKAIALDLQRTIESRAHILERDSRGQVDDLLRIEMALEVLEDLVGNVHRRQRHLFCIAERGPLSRREQRILDVIREGGKLLIAYSKLAATGSVDVYSKNAADHLRGAQARRRRAQASIGADAIRSKLVWILNVSPLGLQTRAKRHYFRPGE